VRLLLLRRQHVVFPRCGAMPEIPQKVVSRLSHLAVLEALLKAVLGAVPTSVWNPEVALALGGEWLATQLVGSSSEMCCNPLHAGRSCWLLVVAVCNQLHAGRSCWLQWLCCNQLHACCSCLLQWVCCNQLHAGRVMLVHGVRCNPLHAGCSWWLHCNPWNGGFSSVCLSVACESYSHK
jgi:hypothetical protein